MTLLWTQETLLAATEFNPVTSLWPSASVVLFCSFLAVTNIWQPHLHLLRTLSLHPLKNLIPSPTICYHYHQVHFLHRLLRSYRAYTLLQVTVNPLLDSLQLSQYLTLDLLLSTFYQIIHNDGLIHRYRLHPSKLKQVGLSWLC